jgi:hypothetical protein
LQCKEQGRQGKQANRLCSRCPTQQQQSARVTKTAGGGPQMVRHTHRQHAFRRLRKTQLRVKYLACGDCLQAGCEQVQLQN